jgi:aminopeptidase-like protein
MINEIDQYLKRLFSITRSITGHGNRETLGILQEIVPLNIKEYKSGEKVYDWTIPAEWHPKNAWIKDSDGNIIIDFNLCNIHLVGYSHSVKKRLSFAELKHHLHVHPTLAEAIPYRTSYYKKDWGFCVTQVQYNLLSNHEEKLEVLIDADFDDNGSLSVGELIIQGTSSKEILISTYL